MIRNARYVIAVHDLERSARYYRDVLGFDVKEIDDPGWRFFVRDQCCIMAGECRDARSPRDLGDHSYFAYIEVDDIDQLHEAVMKKGATLVKDLRSEPWGMREFGIRTVDGHRIMFGCPVVKASDDFFESQPVYLCRLDEIVDNSDDDRAVEQMILLAEIVKKLGYQMMSGAQPNVDEVWARRIAH